MATAVFDEKLVIVITVCRSKHTFCGNCGDNRGSLLYRNGTTDGVWCVETAGMSEHKHDRASLCFIQAITLLVWSLNNPTPHLERLTDCPYGNILRLASLEPIPVYVSRLVGLQCFQIC